MFGFKNNYGRMQGDGSVNLKNGGLFSFSSEQPGQFQIAPPGQMMGQPQHQMGGMQQMGGQQMGQPWQQPMQDWRAAKPDWQGGGFDNRDAFRTAKQDWRMQQPNRGFFGGY